MCREDNLNYDSESHFHIKECKKTSRKVLFLTLGALKRSGKTKETKEN